MKTLKATIIFTHTSPETRSELAEELEEVCEQYDAKIDIQDDY